MVFEGCACRAAFYAGVAAAVSESKLPIAITAGTSSGTLPAVALAAGVAHKLPGVFRSVAGRPLVSLKRALWNRTIFDFSHLLRTTIEQNLDKPDLRAAKVEALVVATRLKGLVRAVFSSREEPSMLEPMLASCFFPVFYGRTVRLRDAVHIDGGFVDNLPVELLVERGATEIVAVVPDAAGLSFKDLRRRSWKPEVRGARLRVVHPRRPLELGSWDLDRDRVERAIDEGYACGRELAAG